LGAVCGFDRVGRPRKGHIEVRALSGTADAMVAASSMPVHGTQQRRPSSHAQRRPIAGQSRLVPRRSAMSFSSCTPRFARSMPVRGFASPLDAAVAALFGAPSTSACASGGSTDGACAQPDASFVRLPVDIHETDGTFVITASLPGFRKEDVAIEMKDGVLTITAERSETTATHGSTQPTAARPAIQWHRRERRLVNWTRSLRLPEGVTGEGITAELKDGVLTVTVPQPKKQDGVRISVN
jgi:HSP20 family molecular chaperone IbpA